MPSKQRTGRGAKAKKDQAWNGYIREEMNLDGGKEYDQDEDGLPVPRDDEGEPLSTDRGVLWKVVFIPPLSRHYCLPTARILKFTL